MLCDAPNMWMAWPRVLYSTIAVMSTRVGVYLFIRSGCTVQYCNDVLYSMRGVVTMENFKGQLSARLLLLYSTNLIQYNNGARFTVNRSVGKSPGRCKTETVMVWRSRFNNAISSNRGDETAAESVGARSASLSDCPGLLARWLPVLGQAVRAIGVHLSWRIQCLIEQGSSRRARWCVWQARPWLDS
jgi:hypothetical protein